MRRRSRISSATPKDPRPKKSTMSCTIDTWASRPEADLARQRTPLRGDTFSGIMPSLSGAGPLGLGVRRRGTAIMPPDSEYVPPGSVAELLRRYSIGERNFAETDL